MDKNDAKHHLSRAECNALRGIAILGIVLHNWTHWLPVAVKENEYTFTLHNAKRFAYILQHPDHNFLLHCLSFLGHYGVPLFLFLSGYGLVRKYENDNHSIGTLQFIGNHYKKLFRMMIIGFALFVAVDNITGNSFSYSVIGIVSQLLMVNNFLPEPHHVIWPGPYWFFSLMLQLYVIYRLLLYRRGDVWLLVLVVAAWLVQALLPLEEKATLNYLRYNFVGSLLPFCLGVFAGRHGLPWHRRTAHAVALLLAVVAVVWGSYAYQTWLLVPIAVCVGGVAMVRLLPDSVLKPLVWTGAVSSAVFILHPAVRKILLPVHHQADPYTTLLLYLIITLTAAWLAMPLLKGHKDK